MQIHIDPLGVTFSDPLGVTFSDPSDADAVRVGTQLLDAVREPTDDERVMTEVSAKSCGPLVDRWQRAGNHDTVAEAAIQAGAFLVSGDAAMPGVTLDDDAELTLTVKPFTPAPEVATECSV
jgi:hypothetical protein